MIYYCYNCKRGIVFIVLLVQNDKENHYIFKEKVILWRHKKYILKYIFTIHVRFKSLWGSLSSLFYVYIVYHWSKSVLFFVHVKKKKKNCYYSNNSSLFLIVGSWMYEKRNAYFNSKISLTTSSILQLVKQNLCTIISRQYPKSSSMLFSLFLTIK